MEGIKDAPIEKRGGADRKYWRTNGFHRLQTKWGEDARLRRMVSRDRRGGSACPVLPGKCLWSLSFWYLCICIACFFTEHLHVSDWRDIVLACICPPSSHCVISQLSCPKKGTNTADINEVGWTVSKSTAFTISCMDAECDGRFPPFLSGLVLTYDFDHAISHPKSMRGVRSCAFSSCWHRWHPNEVKESLLALISDGKSC